MSANPNPGTATGNRVGGTFAGATRASGRGRRSGGHGRSIQYLYGTRRRGNIDVVDFLWGNSTQASRDTRRAQLQKWGIGLFGGRQSIRDILRDYNGVTKLTESVALDLLISIGHEIVESRQGIADLAGISTQQVTALQGSSQGLIDLQNMIQFQDLSDDHTIDFENNLKLYKEIARLG